MSEKTQEQLNNEYANALAQIGLRQNQINDIQQDMKQFYHAINNLKLDSAKLEKKMKAEKDVQDTNVVSDIEVLDNVVNI